jgi:hypothetical protein
MNVKYLHEGKQLRNAVNKDERDGKDDDMRMRMMMRIMMI